MTTTRLVTNLAYGIYGNRSAFVTATRTHLTEAERLAVLEREDVRELLAELPENAEAERLADMARGFQADTYKD